MSIIEVKNLVKEYQRKKCKPGITGAIQGLLKPEYCPVRAVDDISFSIKQGEAVGYVGPNGSGKSTTIKMLSGILTPSDGIVKVSGICPNKDRMKNNKHIGVVFGNRSQLWWDVPVIESFRLFQKLYEIPKNIFEQNLEEFIDILDLKSFLYVPERQLSLGQRMRCNITAAFLHNPRVVYLDEPTIGLDAESKHRIRKFIRTVNQEKQTTFIITSHDFQDIDALCGRIILINHGKIILDSDITKVKRDFNKYKSVKLLVGAEKAVDLTKFSLRGATFSQPGQFSIDADCEMEKVDVMRVIDYISQFHTIEDVSISGREIEAIIQDIIAQSC